MKPSIDTPAMHVRVIRGRIAATPHATAAA